MRKAQITQDALSVSAEDRIRLAQVLWNGVHSVPDEDQLRYKQETIEEALRHDAELESGRDPGIPHDEVMARLRKKFG